jgi:hypothetical protein
VIGRYARIVVITGMAVEASVLAKLIGMTEILAEVIAAV